MSRALLDSNVLVAAVFARHAEHAMSAALFEMAWPGEFVVAAHSFAESFNTLTRQSAGSPFQMPPEAAWAALEAIASRTTLVGLTSAQTFDGVRQYAATGGVGPRLYDFLIGRSAVLSGAESLVTWNLRHMQSLFPTLTSETPREFVRRATQH